ncbi:MAG: tetratricopeptide repeat protein [Alphaproteobacteria bacterium]
MAQANPAAPSSGGRGIGDTRSANGASHFGSYLAGRLASDEHDTVSAAKFLEQALAHDPDNADLVRQTLVAMVLDGRMEEAVGLAGRLVKGDPAAAVANLVLAVEAVKRREFAGAKARLAGLPRAGLNALLIPMIEAWVEVGLGRVDAGLEVLASLEENEAFAPFHHFHRGLINDLGGRVEPAEEAYQAATEAQPGGAYRAVAAFGAFYERAGKPHEARRVYEAFLEENPGTLWLEDTLARLNDGAGAERLVGDARAGVAEALFGAASALHRENAGEAALFHVRMAVYLSPGTDVMQLLVGDILEMRHRLEAALHAYRAVDAVSPVSWSSRLRGAAAQDVLGRTEEAVAELRAMAEERPVRTDALVALGDILRAKERWTEAVTAYDDALARIEKLEKRHWRLLYARGVVLERSKQWPRAEADFLKALELSPDLPFVLNYLGYSWVDQGVHLERALKMIERAVEQRPDDGYIVDSLGWALYRLEDFEGAVRELERAIELRPEDPVINDHLGDAYWRVGRRVEARFQWQRALSLEPEEGLVATIEEKVKHGLAAGAAPGDGI